MKRLSTGGLAVISAAVALLSAAPSFGDGVERSRGQLLEVIVLDHNQLFKHDVNLNRVDTDTYPAELRFPTYRSDARFYRIDEDIMRIGNGTDDALTFFASIARPGDVPGLIPSSLASCGQRVCALLLSEAIGCRGNMVVGGYAEGSTPIFSGAIAEDGFCPKDMIPRGTDVVVLSQAPFVNERARQTFFRIFNQNLVLTQVFQGPTLEFLAQAISANWDDTGSAFVLDTNFGGFNRVLKVSLSNGQIIAFSQNRANPVPFATRDITHFPAGNEVVVSSQNTGTRQYRLTAYNESTLAFTRERVFSY